ncbi:Alpha/Beta hydrolase protein [Aspergillus karnatakaensis]|uniref:alpha/beta hydrolase n=1 Tax=Aspergillus karnatakaensis TaxID=1810916 RepID=UPI003CCE0155
MSSSQLSTHPFKSVGDLLLTIDVSKPPGARDSGVVLLHFHGGFLVLGEKITFPPHWLINACHARGWTYATPSYRLLPEATGLEILSDALDAVNWAGNNICDRVIIAGSSAGGYLALAATAHPSLEDIQGAVQDIKNAMGDGQVLDGYAFPADPSTDVRFRWIRAMHEAALYPDVLTRRDGLAGEILANGVETIPVEFRPLFPVSFGLRGDFPPTILLHGDEDVLVDFGQSATSVLQDKGTGLMRKGSSISILKQPEDLAR